MNIRLFVSFPAGIAPAGKLFAPDSFIMTEAELYARDIAVFVGE